MTYVRIKIKLELSDITRNIVFHKVALSHFSQVGMVCDDFRFLTDATDLTVSGMWSRS